MLVIGMVVVVSVVWYNVARIDSVFCDDGGGDGGRNRGASGDKGNGRRGILLLVILVHICGGGRGG